MLTGGEVYSQEGRWVGVSCLFCAWLREEHSQVTQLVNIWVCPLPGHTVGGYLGLCPLPVWVGPLGCVWHSGLQCAVPSVQSPHKQQLIPSEHVLACPTNKQTGPLCPAGGTVCATRDLWLAKRLLNKGKAPVQVSVAAPAKK